MTPGQWSGRLARQLRAAGAAGRPGCGPRGRAGPPERRAPAGGHRRQSRRQVRRGLRASGLGRSPAPAGRPARASGRLAPGQAAARRGRACGPGMARPSGAVSSASPGRRPASRGCRSRPRRWSRPAPVPAALRPGGTVPGRAVPGGAAPGGAGPGRGQQAADRGGVRPGLRIPVQQGLDDVAQRAGRPGPRRFLVGDRGQDRDGVAPVVERPAPFHRGVQGRSQRPQVRGRAGRRRPGSVLAR